jgi:glycosyltransferase involved in cell wall biosynthesis
MEVIVVDDASTDDTPGMVQAYTDVRYLRHAKNRGPSAARNTAIRASTGKYVALLDDDDVWYPHRLRVQVPFLETHPEFGAVYGQNRLYGEGMDVIWPDASLAPSGNVFRAFLMNDVIAIGSLLIRRDAFEKAGYFDETITMPSMEHYDMCVRLAFHVPFKFIPRPVYIHRFWKEGGWLNSVVSGRYERDLSYVVDKALAYLPNTVEPDTIRHDVRTQVYWAIVHNLHDFAKTDEKVAHARALALIYPRESSVARNVRDLINWRKDKLQTVISKWRSLATEVRAAALKQGLGRWLTRRLLADVWLQAAIMLQEAGNLLASVYASTRSAVYNPCPITSGIVTFLLHLFFRE